MVGSEGPTDANQAWRRPLPRIGARVEVMVVGAKPGPRAKYGVGVVSGIDWDSVFRTWRVVVRFDEPAGTYYGGPIRGSSTFPGNVHVVGADERPFSTMPPMEIEELHEVRRKEFWRNIDPATGLTDPSIRSSD